MTFAIENNHETNPKMLYSWKMPYLIGGTIEMGITYISFCKKCFVAFRNFITVLLWPLVM